MHRHLMMLCALAAVTVALADPGAVTWSGGTLRLMDEHPTISLVSETIILEPNASATRVTADLQFRNEGDACIAQMGFPTLTFPGPGYHLVRNFSVAADGEPIEAREAEQVQPLEFGEQQRSCLWHLFEVPFEAEQQRALRVSYDEAREHYMWGWIAVPYVLQTGATWRGDVRDINLEVRLGERLNYHRVALADRHVNLDSSGLPDEGLLPAQLDGATLRWSTSDYDGTPALVWLSAELGPAEVIVDDGQPDYWSNWQTACWRDGRLLVEADALAGWLLASVTERADASVTLVKEERSVSLPVTRFEPGYVPQETEFVDPAPAVQAFGGSVTTSTNDAGDLVLRVTTCPDSAASARATALFPTQALDYRLKCLRALAQRWPDEIPDVCAQILARDQEEALVLAWCVGHLQAGGTPVERPWELVGRISGGGFREAKVAEAILSATDGCEFAGALAMVEPNTTGMRSLLIAGISACEDWQQGEARGMNAGIALRRLHAAGAADALIQAVIGHQGRQASEDAMVALGALGDDSAVDFLKAQALDRNAHTRDINCVAAQALALMGTPTALQASLDIWRTSEDREVQARAFRGLKVACGQDEAIWHTYGVVLPAWEPARMAPQEGRRLCRELLAQVDAASLDERRVSDLTSLLRYLDQQEGRAGG